jgi:hypothetical protein
MAGMSAQGQFGPVLCPGLTPFIFVPRIQFAPSLPAAVACWQSSCDYFGFIDMIAAIRQFC